MCSKNKDDDQLCGSVFAYAKSRFSHDMVQYYIPCEVGSHFMSLDPRIHARGLGYRIKIQYMLKMWYFWFKGF